MASVPAAVYTVVVILAAIASATISAWHGTIDGQTYAAIVTGSLGLGAGAGIHAAGTQSATRTAERTAERIAGVASTSQGGSS